MAEDEGCFGRLSIPRRAWAPPGIRPHAPHQVIREYSYVYAAVAPAEGKMTSLILPSADTEMMNLFLEHVSSTYAKYFVLMQVDQAGWHVTKDLTIPDNMRLIAQPAYSPELNPVEHIWEELREKQLANLALPSLDDVIDKVCEGLNQLEALTTIYHTGVCLTKQAMAEVETHVQRLIGLERWFVDISCTTSASPDT